MKKLSNHPAHAEGNCSAVPQVGASGPAPRTVGYASRADRPKMGCCWTVTKLIPATLVALTLTVAVPAQKSGSEELLRHTVQKGDTLWGLSGGYLDDNLMWPRIWEVNPGIADPHWIFPGQLVKIPLAGPPAAAPPSTALSEPAQATRYPVDPRLTALARERGGERQPLSLLVSQSALPMVADGLASERERAGAEFNYSDYRGIGMITRQLPDGGRVLGTEQGWEHAAGGERVLIEAPTAPPGSRFGVYRNLGPVAALKEREGEREYLLADIAVIEVVSERPGQTTAMVRHAFSGLKPDDLLGPVPEQLQVVASPTRDSLAAPATVVALQHQRLLAGPGDVVYLDAGSNQGLAPGQRLAVRSQDRELVSRPAGELMVLRVTTDRAAALVSAKSRDAVKTGDLAGGEW